MPVLDLAELPAAITPRAPLVGLDLGEKTIGVAVSDATWMIASPLQTIRKTKFTDDAAALFKLMESRRARGIVIGLPVNMDGTEGPRCQSSRAFGRNLLRLRDDGFIGVRLRRWIRAPGRRAARRDRQRRARRGQQGPGRAQARAGQADDVGGVEENLRHREHPALAAIVADRRPADHQRRAGIVAPVQVRHPGQVGAVRIDLEPHGHRRLAPVVAHAYRPGLRAEDLRRTVRRRHRAALRPPNGATAEHRPSSWSGARRTPGPRLGAAAAHAGEQGHPASRRPTTSGRHRAWRAHHRHR